MSDSRTRKVGESEDLCEDLSWYNIDPDCSEEEFLAVSKVYARDIIAEYELSVDITTIDWEISKRAKRRAGLIKYEDKTPTAIVLSWKLFANEGWDAMAATIRHELIHAHLLNTNKDASHGADFKSLAEELKTHVHCDRFVEPEWIIRCTDCGCEFPRYRRSKVVKNPEQYSCGDCGGTLISEANT
jgi:predicted SprT family Zn-dependent metalloprotease